MPYRINNGYIRPIDERPKTSKQGPQKAVENGSFQKALKQEIGKRQGLGTSRIKVSGHASQRLIERNISLNDNDMKTLESAMDKAEAKGARESLLLYKDIAFIASIKSRTLITAVDPKESKEKIFTNIDSAVFLD